ncbi:MAG: hypothetical protein U0270_27755 [Labilithrix sp.]
MTRSGVGALGALLAVAGIVGACVIADPPTELPTAPALRPIILRATAVPPTTGVITSWPDRFIIQVQLSDARETIYASYYVDYNPATDEGYVDTIPSTPSSGTNDPVRQIEFAIAEPSRDGCHTVEVVVARVFSRSQHTPASADDGDTITWFYSPNGDLAGCPVVDAGLSPDAAALSALDGGDGGS